MKRLMTRTMAEAPWGPGVARILAGAIDAVDPHQAVLRALERSGDSLHLAGQEYDLSRTRRVLLVGAGKAAAPMAAGVAEILEDRLDRGLLIVKEGHADYPGVPALILIVEAGHPVPDVRGVAGSRQLAALLGSLTPEDLVICLISGGGSALLTLPADDVDQRDLQELTRLLLASGANIGEINTLRRHLDLMKGGGLARLAAPALVLTLILSDVVGDPLEAIASGPTAPDPTDFSDAREILQRYDLLEKAPAGILARIQTGVEGGLPENPAPGDPIFSRVQNAIVGSNRMAAEAAIRQAQTEGYQTLLLTTSLQGEAREVGRILASLAGGMASDGLPLPRPGLVVAGGETTVKILGSGLGGRNSELALGGVRELAGLPDVALLTLATDGGDGPTDAAGALATGETLRKAGDLGLDPAEFLARNDSYHFFNPLGDLLKPGPTLTNVNDLAFVFAF